MQARILGTFLAVLAATASTVTALPVDKHDVYRGDVDTLGMPLPVVPIDPSIMPVEPITPTPVTDNLSAPSADKSVEGVPGEPEPAQDPERLDGGPIYMPFPLFNLTDFPLPNMPLPVDSSTPVPEIVGHAAEKPEPIVPVEALERMMPVEPVTPIPVTGYMDSKPQVDDVASANSGTVEKRTENYLCDASGCTFYVNGQPMDMDGDGKHGRPHADDKPTRSVVERKWRA